MMHGLDVVMTLYGWTLSAELGTTEDAQPRTIENNEFEPRFEDTVSRGPACIAGLRYAVPGGRLLKTAL